MSFLPTLFLVFVSIFRPQEIWTFLQPFQLLNLLTGLAALGVFLEFTLSNRRKEIHTPQIPFLIAFVVISYISTGVASLAHGLSVATTRTTISAVFMIVVMYGVRSVMRLRTLLVVLVAICVFVSGVAIHLGYAPAQCIEVPGDDPDALEMGRGNPDGRECETRGICYKDAKPEVEYVCEKVGLFKTVTIMQRVRWRGTLGDPNELSVFIAMTVPLLLTLSFYGRKRWKGIVITLPLLGICLYAVILSQSRGGQLVIGTVFAGYFVSRYGKKGLLGGLLALPVLLLGGRSDGDASTEERIGILYDGIRLAMRHPLLGVGIENFTDEIGHTAHNTYLLTGAELGLPGFIIWTALFWSSVKIPLTAVRQPPQDFDPAMKALCLSLVVSFLGMAVGIFFLSFTYKQLLFVWLGMAGAVYGIIRQNHPDFEVRIGPKDILGCAAFDVVILFFIFVYTRIKA